MQRGFIVFARKAEERDREREIEEKKKGTEKTFEEIIVENFPNMGKEIATQLQPSTESPIQDKSKEKHAKTY